MHIGYRGLNQLHVDRLHTLARRSARYLKKPEDAVLTQIPKGLKAGQIVGILAIPNLTLEILPKIDDDKNNTRMALVRMLNVVYDLRISDGEITALSKQQFDLLEILIRLFSIRLLTAVRRGLPRRYINHEEDLRLLRGKLDVTRQVTYLAARSDLIACRYDELSPDTPLNRVLKATVLKLSDISRSTANVRLLNELKIHFDCVSNVQNPLNELVRLDRTNNTYHNLYRWACLFLKGDYQTTTSGQISGFSLLFAMNDLFEKFIGNILKRTLENPPESRVLLQNKAHSVLLNENGQKIFNLIPDVVIRSNNKECIVLDTKWKHLNPKDDIKLGVEQSDIYQMMAYAHAYEPKRLILLYPWNKNIASEPGILCRWKLSGMKIPFHVATVKVGYSNMKDFYKEIGSTLISFATLTDDGP